MEKEESAAASLSSICFREIEPADMEEVIALHNQCFPIKYERSFYRSLVSGDLYFALAAVDTETPGKPIVGLISAAMGTEGQAEDEDLLRWSLSWKERELVYILTLGVLPTHRRVGIGWCSSCPYFSSCSSSLFFLFFLFFFFFSFLCHRFHLSSLPPPPSFIDSHTCRNNKANQLLRHLIEYTTQERPNCKAVYLHVLTTNYPAINFYEQNHFVRLRTLHNYYNIENTDSGDSYLYVRYVNGGKPPLTWQDVIDWGWMLLYSFLQTLKRTLRWPARSRSNNKRNTSRRPHED
ncbi:N-alpha-acetyltransferase 60 [Balamuthia mandrillaris]